MSRHAHAIYCDDIRHELGGKLTLVGVYSRHLLVPSFPAVLPKLCLLVDVVTLENKPFEKLKIRVLLDETRLAEVEISSEDIRAGFENVPQIDDASDTERRLTFAAHFVFSPLKFDGPGMIRIRVETENGEIRANALRVDQMIGNSNALFEQLSE